MKSFVPDFGSIMSAIPSQAEGQRMVQSAGQSSFEQSKMFSDAVRQAQKIAAEKKRKEEEEKRLEEKRKLASDVLEAWDMQELSDIELYGMPQADIDEYERKMQIFSPGMSDAQKYRRAASLFMPYDEEGAAQMLKYADAREIKEMELAAQQKKASSQNERVKLQTAYGATLREAEGIRDNIRNLQASGDFDAARKEMARLRPLQQRLKVQYLALNEMSPEAYPMIDQQQTPAEDAPEVINQELLALAQGAVSADGKTINTALFNGLSSDQRREALRLAKEEQALKRSSYEYGQQQESDKVKRKEEKLKLQDLEAGSAAQIKAAGYWREAKDAAKNVRPIKLIDYNKYQGGSGIKIIDIYNKTKNVSPELQSALQWVMPLLRADSGAAIGQEEIGNFIATYIPVEGDDANTILQKQKARRHKLEAMRKAGGRAAERKTTEEGGFEYTTRDGKKYQRKKGTFAWKEVK